MTPDMLRASHIKPWAEATVEERLDARNGLFLAPNVDAAFDRGWISFSDEGDVLVGAPLTPEEARQMGIEGRLRCDLDARMRTYLAYHRRKHGFD